jgi:tetratricopeptide (TPR) repeat protein
MEELGSHRGIAHTLDTLGNVHLGRGEPVPAADYFRRALAEFRETGERSGQAWSINGLGEAAQLAADPLGALKLHLEALAIATTDGNRHQQARSHAFLGRAHRALDAGAVARTHYERAYDIYRDLGMPEAEEMRTHLTGAPAT